MGLRLGDILQSNALKLRRLRTELKSQIKNLKKEKYDERKIMTTEKSETRGGKRAGAGRPRGSGTGRKTKSSSISLTPEQWIKLDTLRETINRSKWIGQQIDVATDLKINQNHDSKA